jgi:hypothetical protein
MFVGYLSWLITQEQADPIPNVGFSLAETMDTLPT